MDYKVASFFSGIGGFDLGLERAGMNVIFQCEINKFAQQILRKHWPDIPLATDINELSPSDIPDSNLWCGGFPCQDVSLANQGKRKGLKGDRSGLFFKYAELVEGKKPNWVILENVPGLLNSNNGKDFQVILETLDELGYCVSWRIFDAKYFGTPQRRRRVFIVASLGNRSSSDVLFEPKGITVAHRAGLGKRETSPRGHDESLPKTDIYSIQHAGIGRKPSAGPQGKGFRNDGESYTLDSRGSSDAVCSPNDPFGIRKTSGFSKKLDSHRYRALGNALAVPIVEWIGKRIVKTNF